jgi:hypothetical protein
MQKYRKWLAIIAIVVNTVAFIMICRSVWHSYTVDKSKPQIATMNYLQCRKQLESEENVLRILNYNVLPMNAFVMAFSIYVCFRLRKQ